MFQKKLKRNVICESCVVFFAFLSYMQHYKSMLTVSVTTTAMRLRDGLPVSIIGKTESVYIGDCETVNFNDCYYKDE